MEIGGVEGQEERVFYYTDRGCVEWIGRKVDREEIDPRIQLIRNIVFVYCYLRMAAPEKLAEFEQMLLETLFEDDEKTKELDPLIFKQHFPRPISV